MSRGAIFHHFRDKDTLFFALAHEDAERMAEVASREGLIQVMRDMLAAPDQFDWLAPGWRSRASCAPTRVQPRLGGAVRGIGRGDHRSATPAEGGRARARRRSQRRAAVLPGSGPGRIGGPDGVRRRSTATRARYWTWWRTRCGAARFAAVRRASIKRGSGAVVGAAAAAQRGARLAQHAVDGSVRPAGARRQFADAGPALVGAAQLNQQLIARHFRLSRRLFRHVCHRGLHAVQHDSRPIA